MEKVSLHDFRDDPWCPSDRSWTKDSVGDIFEVLSISETGRNVSLSRRTFQITEDHLKNWFPLDTDCFKVHYLSKKVLALRYTPEDLNNIKPLLPSLASINVASRYEQAPAHVVSSLHLTIKKKKLFPPSASNNHSKDKSCNITVNPAPKMPTF